MIARNAAGVRDAVTKRKRNLVPQELTPSQVVQLRLPSEVRLVVLTGRKSAWCSAVGNAQERQQSGLESNLPFVMG